jgi:hypothetical protein
MSGPQWKNLPDDLIKCVMEYWSPRNAMNSQQIKKLKEFHKNKKHNKTDPNNYLKMLMENPDKTEYRFRFTKQCLFYKNISYSVRSTEDKEKRINMKTELGYYHNFFISQFCKQQYYTVIDNMIEKRRKQKKLN